MPRRARSLDDPEHPRRRLLAAAADAFGNKGYERTTLHEIAAAAGLPKSAVFYYFPSKQALLAAIAMEIHALLQSHLEHAEHASLPPDAALELVVRGHVRMVIARFPATRFLLHDLPAEMEGLEGIRAARSRYRQRLEGIVERGIAAGVFVAVEPWLAVEALLGMVAYSLAERYSPSWPLDAETIAERYASMAVRALKAP